MTWDANGNITNMQSGLSGVTLGIAWNQVNWRQVGPMSANGTFHFEIYYTVSATLFIEGIGTLWVSEVRTAYGVSSGGGDEPSANALRGYLADVRPWEN